METEKDRPVLETATEASKLPEGDFDFSNQSKERGVAGVRNKDGELSIVMVAPMEAQFQGGKKVTVTAPNGEEKNVLDISLAALSPESTEGAVLSHLQLDREVIIGLLTAAIEQGVLPKPKPAKSKWVPGGKMDQLIKFALDLDARLE